MSPRKKIFISLLFVLISCNKDPESYFDRGLVSFENENYEDAFNQFIQAHELSRDSTLYIDSYFWSGRSLYESKNYNEAIKYFNTLIATDSLNSQYHYYRGLTLWKWNVPWGHGSTLSSREFMPQAIQSLTKAISLDPQPIYLLKRAKVKADLKDHLGAVSDLNLLISTDSTYYDIFTVFADSIAKYQNYTSGDNPVIHYLDAAIEHDPNNSELYYKRSLYGDNSLSNIDKAIQLDPKNHKYFIRRGKLYKQRGDWKNRDRKCQTLWGNNKPSECYDDYFLALNEIQKALSFNKNSGEAYYYLGIIKLELPNKKGCKDLSKAGQLGFERAYRIIKDKCN